LSFAIMPLHRSQMKPGEPASERFAFGCGADQRRGSAVTAAVDSLQVVG
jgi:hypothetical protein